MAVTPASTASRRCARASWHEAARRELGCVPDRGPRPEKHFRCRSGDLTLQLSIRATPGGRLTEAETGAQIYYSEVFAELVSDG